MIMSEMYEAYEGKRYWTKGDVEMAWKKKGEGIVGAMTKVCGVVKEKKRMWEANKVVE